MTDNSPFCLGSSKKKKKQTKICISQIIPDLGCIPEEVGVVANE